MSYGKDKLKIHCEVDHTRELIVEEPEKTVIRSFGFMGGMFAGVPEENNNAQK